jgi:capsid protein
MPRKPTKPRAAGSTKPKAGTSDFLSTGITSRRSYLWVPPPRDMRDDMSAANRKEMVSKMRWGERNSGLVRQILGDLVTYSVGDGIKPQSHASTPEMQERYEAYFAEKAKRIDITNRFSFYQAQSILLRGMIRDGDSFAAKVRNGAGEAKLQLMEAHRVGDPLEGKVPEGTMVHLAEIVMDSPICMYLHPRMPLPFISPLIF